MIDPKLVKAMNQVVKAALDWRRWTLPADGEPDTLDDLEGALSEAVDAYLEQVGDE